MLVSFNPHARVGRDLSDTLLIPNLSVSIHTPVWGVTVSGKVITLVERKGKKSEPHDSITGYKLQTEKGTYEVFRGRRGGLYVWAGGKKTYLPKKVKSQLSDLSKSDK